MGVRSLWTYLRSTIARTIHLRAEVESQPLVVDLLSGCRRYLDRDYVWDFAQMRRRVALDVEALRRAGFELVVFADSGNTPQPNPSWLRRRIRDLQALYELNSILQSDAPGRIRFATDRWRPPLGVTSYLTQAFRDAGCPVYLTKEIADHEGAGLCLKHDAFGILSADTDFLIYPGIRRFLNYTTLRLGKDGEVLVDGIERSLFVRYLGISEEKLPMVAGCDVFPGLEMQDKRYLEYKWRLEYTAEAAVMEINTTPTNLLPMDAHRALEYYKPIEPTGPSPSLLDQYKCSYWNNLKEKKVVPVVSRGVAWDSLSERPCYLVLEPLRRAVYARCGFDTVTEHLCYPHVDPQTWISGKVIEMVPDDVRAPEPPSDVMECVTLACDYLTAAGVLDELHRQVLLCQVHHRSLFLEKGVEFPVVPVMQDLHAASLFLQTIEFLYLGAIETQPACWDVFHGPLYHYLCQDPAQMKSLSPVEVRSSYDWYPILKTRVLTNAVTEQQM